MTVDLDSVKTICVLCWGLIGDVFIRVPVIEALKRRFPDARVVVVVDPSSRGVLERHPDCDELVAFSRNKKPAYLYLWNSINNIVYLREQHFDLCINLYSGGSSPFYTRLINARIRLGFDHTAALRKANNLLVTHPSLCGNWSKAFGLILAPLGVTQDEVRRGTSFYYSQDAQAFASDLLGGKHINFIGFNLGAGGKEKRWPVKCFVELARMINEKYGFVPLIFTNPDMEYLAEEFVIAYKNHGRYLQVPIVSLDKIGAVMEYCSYIVTGDTSLMHMAFGLKRPCLVLFTSTRPEIVQPEDCVCEPCFVEDPTNINECGKPMGSVNISVDYAMERFDALVGEYNEIQENVAMNDSSVGSH